MKTEHCTYYGIDKLVNEGMWQPHAIVGVLDTSDLGIMDIRNCLEGFSHLRVVTIDPELEHITGTWTGILKEGKVVEARLLLMAVDILS